MTEQRMLIDTKELDALFASSAPVLFFKHSNRCECSAVGIEEYRSFLDGRAQRNGLATALIVVQDARPISSEIEARTKVKHQTPQAILVRAGRVLWHASHWGVTAKAMEAAVEEATTFDSERQNVA